MYRRGLTDQALPCDVQGIRLAASAARPDIDDYATLFARGAVKTALIDDIEIVNVIVAGAAMKQVKTVCEGEGSGLSDRSLPFNREGKIHERLVIRFCGKIARSDKK